MLNTSQPAAGRLSGRNTLAKTAKDALLALLLLHLCAFSSSSAQRPQYQEEGAANGHNRRMEQQQGGRCSEYWEFPCDDGQHCIARYDQCDGIEQCPDASDEKNCEQHRERPFEQAPASAHTPAAAKGAQMPLAAATSAPSSSHESSKDGGRIPMELVFMGAAAFVMFAAIVHVLVKLKRRRTLGRGTAIRGFRKGESLVDDEDDLLISQMYS